MDRTNFLEEELTKGIPDKGFTFEECQRFIVHLDDKSDAEILNVKQPKYLLDFQMKIFAKEAREKEAKEISNIKRQAHEMQVKSQQKSNSKQAFENDYNSWLKMQKDNSTYFTKTKDEVMKERPNYKAYGLTEADFSFSERHML